MKTKSKNNIFFPPEWYPQGAIQLTWPHENTDWDYMLEEISDCYIHIAREVLQRQKLLIVCDNALHVKSLLESNGIDTKNLILSELPTNDTWARDHGAISVFVDGEKTVYDFTFNGWGLKFASNFDNQINKGLLCHKIFDRDVNFVSKKNFVLEGGGIETDGKGTLLTTSECLLSPNRNPYLSKEEIEDYLKEIFGLDRVLWLHHGYLAGDDTDSHIDTLARFCDERTIAYVKCKDKNDEHYNALLAMEEELKEFTDFEGKPYTLIPLPMVPEIVVDGERLPATYANFLIMNEAVLVPIYNVSEDKTALKQIQKAFPAKQVVGIDCSAIIRQHGSLHCVTMQYPEGFIA